MDTVRSTLLGQFKLQQSRQNQLESFVQKVISVFLAEALSSTAFEILTVIIAGDSSLDNGQALIARSIYAGIITIYSPLAAWAITKSSFGKSESFIGIVLQLHAKICPVLLAWGWKDWASQLDTLAGTDLWDEFVVAAVLTLIVVALQAMPCFNRNKAGVAKGGESDTLLARYLIVPSSLGLTLGYCWNLVASFIVGKVQDLHKVSISGTQTGTAAPAYAFQFIVQAVYAIIVSIIITWLSVCLVKRADAAKEANAETDAEAAKSGEQGHAHVEDLHRWEGYYYQTFTQLSISSMSFVYGWALLDTMDDFAFGVMFHCESYSACSYQANFIYAGAVTFFFSMVAAMLQRWHDFEESSAVLSKGIQLQINAMILTVGWAWMNYYTVFMTHATSDAEAGLTVVIYICSFIVIFVATSIIMFVFQRMKIGLTRAHKKAIEELQLVEAK